MHSRLISSIFLVAYKHLALLRAVSEMHNMRGSWQTTNHLRRSRSIALSIISINHLPAMPTLATLEVDRRWAEDGRACGPARDPSIAAC